MHICLGAVTAYLFISHLVLQGFELTFVLAPHLSLLHAELTAELLLLLPLPLPSISQLNCCVQEKCGTGVRYRAGTSQLPACRWACAGQCGAVRVCEGTACGYVTGTDSGTAACLPSTWAAWYATWFLIQLTPEGVVFSFHFFSFLFFSPSLN